MRGEGEEKRTERREGGRAGREDEEGGFSLSS